MEELLLKLQAVSNVAVHFEFHTKSFQKYANIAFQCTYPVTDSEK